MIHRRLGALRRLLACVRGTSVVELAIAAPFFAAMLVGIVDISRGFAFKLRMQQAAARGLEMAAIGQTATTDAQLQATVASAAGVTQDKVVITRTLECDNVASTNASCTSTQETARYVEVRVTGTFTPVFKYGWLGQSYATWQSNGTVLIAAKAVGRIQ